MADCIVLPEKVLAHLTAKVNEMRVAKDPFVLDEFIQSTYKDFVTGFKDEDRALANLRIVPGTLKDMFLDDELYEYMNVSPKDLTKILKDFNTGVTAVAAYVGVTTAPAVKEIKELKKIQNNEKTSGTAPKVSVNYEIDEAVFTAKPKSILTSTWQTAYVRTLDEIMEEENVSLEDAKELQKKDKYRNVESLAMEPYIEFQQSVVNLMSNTTADNDSRKLNIEGVEGGYGLTMMSASLIDDTQRLPSEQRYLDDGSDKAKAKKRADQNKRVAMVVTDGLGNILYFDKDNNLTTKENDGKMRYMLMRKAPGKDATGNYKFSEAGVQSPEQVATKGGDLTLIKGELTRQVNDVVKVHEYINANPETNKVRGYITGGTKGYLQFEKDERFPMGEIVLDNPFTFNINTETGAKRAGIVSFSIPGISSPIILYQDKISDDDVELLVSILTEDVMMPNELGKLVPMPMENRKEAFDNLAAFNDKNPTLQVIITPQGMSVVIKGETLDLKMPDAKAKIIDVLSSSFPDYRNPLNINEVKSYQKSGKRVWSTSDDDIAEAPEDDVIMQRDGAKALYFRLKRLRYNVNNNLKGSQVTPYKLDRTAKDIIVRKLAPTSYNEWVKKNSWITARPNANNKLVGHNGNFTYNIPLDESNKVYGVKDNVDKGIKDAEKSNKPTTSGLSQKMLTLDEINKKLDRLALRKGRKGREHITKAQLDTAKNWYNKESGLAKWKSFTEAFNMVNTGDENVIAQFTLAGITLYEGSDYTDLYHEGWHVFEELFLTIPDKDAYRAEIRKLPGTFTNYKNETVSFAKATPLELKEFLGEDFRKFALSDGKLILNGRPARNSLFRRIWNFLKALFGKTSIKEVIATQNRVDYFTELFDKLRLGQLHDLTFDQRNAEFTTLNSGVLPINKEHVLPEGMGYGDSDLMVSILDSWIASSDVLANLRTGLSGVQLQKFKDLKSTTQPTQEEIDELVALEEELDNKRRHVSEFDAMKIPEFRVEIYKELREKLIDKRGDYMGPFLDNSQEKADAMMLDYTIRQFGDPGSSATPTEGEGMIFYHLMNTRFLNYADRLSLEDSLEEDELVSSERQLAKDRPGNTAVLREIASEFEGIYSVLSGIHDMEVADLEATLGVRPLMRDEDVLNSLARMFEGPDKSRETLYNKMRENASIPEYSFVIQILNKMGSPYNVTNESVQKLWTELQVVSNMPLIPLIQTTQNTTVKGVRESTVGEAFSDTTRLQNNWNNGFVNRQPDERSILTRYILKDDKNSNYLNVKKVVKDFGIKQGRSTILDQSRAFEFLQAIGANLDDTVSIRRELTGEDKIKYGAAALFRRFRTINEWEESNKKTYKLWNLKAVFKDNLTTKFQDLSREQYRNLTGEGKNFENILKLHLAFDRSANYTVSGPTNKNVQKLSLPSTKSKIVTDLNIGNSFPEVIEKPNMRYLGFAKSFMSRYSLILNKMFNLKSDLTRTDTGKEKTKLELVNISGIARTKNGDEFVMGATTAEEDKLSRAYMNLTQTLSLGWSSYMVPAEKSNNYGIGIKGYEYINSIDFIAPSAAESSGRKQFKKIMLDYLSGEMDRIDYLNSIPADHPDRFVMAKFGKEYVSLYDRGKEFRIFESVLKNSTKEMLKTLKREDSESLNSYFAKEKPDAEKSWDIEVYNAITRDLDEYVEYLIEDFGRTIGDLEFFDINMRDKMLKRKNRNITPSDEETERLKRAAIEATVVASWFHNLEEAILFYGDPMQWEPADLVKRYPMFNSTGLAFDNSTTNKARINHLIASGEAYKYADSEWYDTNFGPAQKPEWGDFLKTAVIADPKIKSPYRAIYKEAFVEHFKASPAYKEGKWSDEDMEAAAEKKVKIFDDMVIGDSAAFLTLDTYRLLRLSNGTWGKTMDRQYEKILNKEPLTKEDLTHFMPIVKYQYAGPLDKEGVDAKALHKYTLMPLVPTVIQNTELEVLHNKMVSQGIAYAMFASGSKKFNVTSNGELDTWYKEDGKTLAFADPEYNFTPNIISIAFLKEQVKINTKFKKKTVSPVQQRAILVHGAMEFGVPIDFMIDEEDNVVRIKAWNKLSSKAKTKESQEWTRVEEHRLAIDALVKSEILVMTHEFGAEKNGKFDFTKFMNVVKKEFDRNDKFGAHTKYHVNAIKNNIKDFSLLPVAEDIEKMMISYILKRVIGAKVNGEVLNLISGIGLGKVGGESTEGLTQEEIYRRGSNGYAGPWRDKNKDGTYGLTHAGKVGIAFHPNFRSLLKVDDLNGVRIGTLDRLNVMIKDEAWLNAKNATGTNRDLVLTIGPRVPTNLLNTMVFGEVFHFYPEEFGEKIITYGELSAIAGSDMDGDNLKMQFPNLIVINGKSQLAKDITRAKAKELHRLLVNAGITNDTADVLHRYTKINLESDVLSKQYFRDKLKDKFAVVDNLLVNIFGDEWVEDIRNASGNIDSFEDFYNRLNRKSIENRGLLAMKGLLELPRNFALLVMPNTTDSLEELAAQVAPYTREYEPSDTVFNEQKHVSSTTALELPFHLNMQEVFKYFSKGIGISAVHNKYTPLASASNLRLKNSYTIQQGRNTYDRPIKFLLPHNTLKVGDINYISLAGLYDVEGKSLIMEMNSEELNSLVDGAKKPFPADLMVSDYTLPVTHLLGSAGVTRPKRAWFVANPLVRQYVRYFINGKGVVSNLQPDGGAPRWEWAKNYARDKMLRELFDIQDPAGYISTKRSMDRIQDVLANATVSNRSMTFNMPASENITGKDTTTEKLGEEGKRTASTRVASERLGVVGEFIRFNDRPQVYRITKVEMLTKEKIADPAWVKEWSRKEGWTEQYFRDLVAKDARQVRPGAFQTTFEKVSDDEVVPLDFTDIENLRSRVEDTQGEVFGVDLEPTAMDKVILLHYMQLEDMDSVKKLKINSNYDTKKKKSLFALSNRDFIIEDLRSNSQLVEQSVNAYLDDTIIGSFQLTDFMTKIVSAMFPLRAHRFVRTFLLDKTSTGALKAVSDRTWDDQDKLVDQFFNQLMGAFFQNSLRYFNINKLDSYKGFGVSDKTPVKPIANLEKHGVAITMDENRENAVIHIDKKSLRALYPIREKSEYRQKGYMPLEQGTTISDQEFFHFTIEREYLRHLMAPKEVSATPIAARYYKENLITEKKREGEADDAFDTRMKKRAYEQTLRDMALDNIFLPWRLFNSRDSMAQRLVNIQESRPDLLKRYPILQNLKGVGFENIKDLKNIKLRNNQISGSEINVYHENIIKLQQSDDPAVSSFFKTLPFFAVMQSNYNIANQFSLLKIIPDTGIYELLKKDVNAYMSQFDEAASWLDVNKNDPNLANRRTIESIRTARAVKVKDPSATNAINALQRLEAFWQRFDSSNDVSPEEIPDETGATTAFKKNRNLFTRNKFIDWLGTFVPQAVPSFSTVTPVATPTPWFKYQSPGVLLWTDTNGVKLAETAKANSTMVFVYNATVKPRKDLKSDGDSMLQDVSYSMGIRVRKDNSPYTTNLGTHHVTDETLEANKKRIDEDIAAMVAHITSPVTGKPQLEDLPFVFNPNGYGQALIGADPLTGNNPNPKDAVAPETFRYLSQKLFENFGYMNKNFLTRKEENAYIQKGQPASDEAVDAWLNHCQITATL